MLEFGDVLTNELLKKLPPNRLVNHKIDLDQKTKPSSKDAYILH